MKGVAELRGEALSLDMRASRWALLASHFARVVGHVLYMTLLSPFDDRELFHA